MPIFNHFQNKKSHLRSETHIAYKFYALYPQTSVFSDGNFYLYIENEMSVLDRFFLGIKSWYKSNLHIIDFRCPMCHKKICIWNQIEILR